MCFTPLDHRKLVNSENFDVNYGPCKTWLFRWSKSWRNIFSMAMILSDVMLFLSKISVHLQWASTFCRNLSCIVHWLWSRHCMAGQKQSAKDQETRNVRQALINNGWEIFPLPFQRTSDSNGPDNLYRSSDLGEPHLSGSLCCDEAQILSKSLLQMVLVLVRKHLLGMFFYRLTVGSAQFLALAKTLLRSARLMNNCLQLKKSKCSFRQSSVTYLDHLINAEGIHAMAEKVQAF